MQWASVLLRSVAKLGVVIAWMWLWSTVTSLQYKVWGDLAAHVHKQAWATAPRAPFGCTECKASVQDVFVCKDCGASNLTYTTTGSSSGGSGSAYTREMHEVHANLLITRRLANESIWLTHTDMGERLLATLLRDAVSYPHQTPWVYSASQYVGMVCVAWLMWTELRLIALVLRYLLRVFLMGELHTSPAAAPESPHPQLQLTSGAAPPHKKLHSFNDFLTPHHNSDEYSMFTPRGNKHE